MTTDHLAYLDKELASSLADAVAMAAVDRPADPITYIAQYLLHAASKRDAVAASAASRDELRAQIRSHKSARAAEEHAAAMKIQKPWKRTAHRRQAENAERVAAIEAYERRRSGEEEPEEEKPVAAPEAAEAAAPPAALPPHAAALKTYFDRHGGVKVLTAQRRKDRRTTAFGLLKASLYLLGFVKSQMTTYEAAVALVKPDFVDSLIAVSVEGKQTRKLKFRNAGRVLRSDDMSRFGAMEIGVSALLLFDFLAFVTEQRRALVLDNREKRAGGAENIEERAGDEEVLPAEELEDGYATDPEPEVEEQPEEEKEASPEEPASE